MAKVIKDTPEEPIAYLIKVLKKMCPDGQPTKYDVSIYKMKQRSFVTFSENSSRNTP